jgi:hypothetical protein
MVKLQIIVGFTKGTYLMKKEKCGYKVASYPRAAEDAEAEKAAGYYPVSMSDPRD